MNNDAIIMHTDSATHGPGRWWIYQRERFPIALNALAIAVFSLAAVGFGSAVSAEQGTPSLAAMLVSFSGSFTFFALLRIADEFKDYADDYRYRPYRPVPRGLVKLSELRRVGIVLALAQFAIALAWSLQLLLLLLAAWGWFLLMSHEFFVPRWLKAHPVVYLLSHMLIMPMIALFASAPAWLGQSVDAQQLLPFAALAFCVGLVGEIGRKIRAPADEELGVETYSALWGQTAAVSLWLIASLATALAAGWACEAFAAGRFITVLLVILLTITLLAGWRFLRSPTTGRARAIEAVSGCWALGAFGAVAAAALLPTYYPV